MTYFVTELDNKSDGRNESVLRVSAIKQWLVTFGYARWVSDKKKGTEGFKLASDRLDATDEKARDENFAKGAATPFNKFTPEQPFTPIDSFAAIESLIKRLSSKIDDHGINSKGVDVKNKIDPNHIKALEALRDSLKTPIEPTLIIKAQSPEGKKLAVKRTPKQQTAVNQAEGNMSENIQPDTTEQVPA
jgi:hypothetical protein